MKKYILLGVLITVLSVFVVAQTLPNYIPENINLEYNPTIPSLLANHTYGSCLIQGDAKINLVGYYNATDNHFYHTASVLFDGRCQQGNGWQKLDLTGINNFISFRTALVQQIATRTMSIYNNQTTSNSNGVVWVRGQ